MRHPKSFTYSSLPLILKLSNWMSWWPVVSHLTKGSWLDIMSGFQSIMQLAHIKHANISEFYALDQHLDKNLVKANIKIKQCRIDKELPFASHRFDNVTLINGLEHLDSPQDILCECYRVLKPGGILQVIVPTPFSRPILEFLAFTIKIQPQISESIREHKMYYDEKTLVPMIVRAGFTSKNIKVWRIKFNCSLYASIKK
ncbi:MAG: methyltransferase domain-containing protein [Candidatus Gottesmanbacteria bacterium]|nr:methyltransferase domain-containing protein [Candidatus Gottesmanbacteria bacterium]